MHVPFIVLVILLASIVPLRAQGTGPLQLQPAPAGLAARLAGTFEGSYVCGQGRTGLRLTLTEGEGEALGGEFAFFPHPDNPGVPSGRFRLVGAADGSGEGFVVSGIEWVDQPEGYRMVGLEGELGAGGGRITGRVLDPACSTFEVERTAAGAPAR